MTEEEQLRGSSVPPTPQKRFNAGYDCELPPDARTELVAPRRARILDRPELATLDASVKGRLYLALLIAVMIVAGLVTTWHQQAERSSENPNKAISQPALAPQPTATPIMLPPGRASRWKEYNPPAPRAELIKLPAPRAQLVHLSEWKVGETRAVKLPYGIEAIANYKGYLDAEWMLPVNGNSIGDAWQVGDNL